MTDTAWGLHLDNPVSVQIAMACTSGTIGCWQGRKNPNIETAPKTREQWLAHDKMLDMVAYLIAKVATDYQIPLEWCDIDDVGRNKRGVSSHHNYSYGSRELHRKALNGAQVTDHWDVPPTFPSDVVLAAAKAYAATMERNESKVDAGRTRKSAAAAAGAKPVKKAAPAKATKKPAKEAAPAKAKKAAAPRRTAKKADPDGDE